MNLQGEIPDQKINKVSFLTGISMKSEIVDNVLRWKVVNLYEIFDFHDKSRCRSTGYSA